VNKSINIAKRLTVAEIKRLIHTTLELDVALKSQSIDADEALQNLLILIAEIKITA
jgi:DNA polymerase III delta subunit